MNVTKGDIVFHYDTFTKEAVEVFVLRGGQNPRVAKIVNAERFAQAPNHRRFSKWGAGNGLGIIKTVFAGHLYKTKTEIFAA